MPLPFNPFSHSSTSTVDGVQYKDAGERRYDSGEPVLAGPSLLPPVQGGSNLGLQILYQSDDAIVDIVFVHGLTGNALSTWHNRTTQTLWPQDLLGQDLPNIRAFTFGYDANVSSFWTQSSKNRLGDHAQNLLGDLVRAREDSDTETRKIIFVCHSLGGLVVQKTLTLSSGRAEQHLQSIEIYTHGIIFLGTPHNGAKLAEWAGLYAKFMGKFKDMNADILAVLEQESEVLRDTQDSFGQLLERRKYKASKIQITCFYEELAVIGIGMIVPTSSAKLFGCDSFGIHANHMDMIKFGSRQDPGYKRVVGELKRWVKSVRALIEAEVSTSNEAREREIAVQKECLRSLHFDGMNSRRDAVDLAFGRTFEWIWTRPWIGFSSWLSTGNDIFWITGKPGSGKSTLMRYISDNPQRITQTLHSKASSTASSPARMLTVTYFFDFRAGSLARSLKGLLRSLLRQLLLLDSALFSKILPTYNEMRTSCSNVSWTQETLKNVLHELLAATSPKYSYILFFIDGLDEFGGSDAEIAAFLDIFARKSPRHTRFILASRPYPDFAFQFRGPFQLRMQTETYGDVDTYLRGRILQIRPTPSTEANRLVLSVKNRAEGVFLWIKLVCDDLERASRRYETFEELLSRVERIPKDVNSLYNRIFDEMDDEDREQTWRMLGIIAQSMSPLKLISFFYVLEASYQDFSCRPNRGTSCTICRNASRTQSLAKYIRRQSAEARAEFPTYHISSFLTGRLHAVCRGLIDVQGDYPRLLHETLSAYAPAKFEMNGLCTLHMNNAIVGDALLLSACINVLSTISPTTVTGEPSSVSLTQQDAIMTVVGYPVELVDYAVRFWVPHAKRAAALTNYGQNTTLNRLSNHNFRAWCTETLRKHSSHIAVPSDLFEMAIYENLHDYITEEIRQLKDQYASRSLTAQEVDASQLDSSRTSHYKDSYGRYLFAVAGTGDTQVAKLLLANAHILSPNGSTMSNGRFFNAISDLNWVPSPSDHMFKHALYRAVFLGHIPVIKLFLKYGAFRGGNLGHMDSRTFLQCGHLVTEKDGDMWLLSSYGDVLGSLAKERPLGLGPRPDLAELVKAKSCPDGEEGGEGLDAILSEVLSMTSLWGPTRFSLYQWRNTPLEFAIRCNYADPHDSFQLLLKSSMHGSLGSSLCDALIAASFHGLNARVLALLEHGADPNSVSDSATSCEAREIHICSPLLSAICNGHFEIVDLLLDHAVNPCKIVHCPGGLEISPLELSLKIWTQTDEDDLFFEIAMSYIICKLYLHGARVRKENEGTFRNEHPELFGKTDEDELREHIDDLLETLEEYKDTTEPEKSSPRLLVHG